MSNLLFFFDEDLPARSRNVHHVYGPVEHLGPIIRGDTPADQGAASIFLSKIYQLPDDTYRMYYWSYSSRCGNDPSEHIPRILVATSTDRLNWTKPDLGQVQIDGKETNILQIAGLDYQVSVGVCPVQLSDGRVRIYFWGCENGTQLWSCLAAESEDGLNFTAINDGKGLLYHPPIPEAGPLLCDVAKQLRRDPEEYERTEGLRMARLQSNDGVTVYGNDKDGFEVFHPYLVDNEPESGRYVDVPYNAASFLRTIAWRTSDDGIAWSDPKIVIWPDEKDPWDLQFYMMPVNDYAGWRIALLGHYRTEAGQQDSFIELAFSRDSHQWSRPLRGVWFHGAHPEDAGGIYPSGEGLVDMGDHWQLYYCGGNSTHDVFDIDGATAHTIMAVKIPKNRLLGVAADKVVGEFITEPIFLSEDEIKIDANVRGWLRAELCDIFGRKIEGYHLMDSDPVSGDCQDHVLRWKGKDSSAYRYKPVRVRFEFTEGEVYCVKY
ncbi:MAG: hypothetical protein MK171_12425 [Pirellulales bacterium]|nr:hypothetical protein [Pirellulales bacterium]